MMLHELGLTQHEFDCAERSRFLLSPQAWMKERLAKFGYVKAGAGCDVEQPKQKRAAR